MKQRSPKRSRVYDRSSDDLERIARQVLTRYFGPPIRNKRTGDVLVRREAVAAKARTHGGRAGLTAPDPWALLEPDESDRSGALLSEIDRLKNKCGRLLCEIARLKARAKQRETELARNRAVKKVRKQWVGSMPDLDKAGKARFAEAIKKTKEKFRKPDYRQEIASSLRKWGLYTSVPSRAALHRWAARTGTRDLHAEILRIHRRRNRTYRIEPHIGITHPSVKPAR